MRVIAGKARHLQLKTIPGENTRPTTDRIKETLFNMLQPYIPGGRFLDLFSGSGGIGIEALSRGAKEAVLVEQNRQAAACIRSNLQFTHLEQDASLMVMDVFRALDMLRGKGVFDVIFMDPPYRALLEKQVLEVLAASDLVDEATLIVVEASADTDFAYVSGLGFEIIKEKKYGSNKHLFLKRGNV